MERRALSAPETARLNARRAAREFVNVKKTIWVGICGLALAIVMGACAGAGPTPTRTPRAVAENIATQTPWIIYIPVTTTREPEIATALPTVTPSEAQPTEPPTRVPPTEGPPPTARPTAEPVTEAPTAPAESPTPESPPPTAAPSCGEAYSIKLLTFPENGARRRAKAGSGAGATIQFKWEPISGTEMDPKLGYRINVSTPRNSVALYMSHNEYLSQGYAILSQQATYGLTQGDDMNANWNVEVIMVSGEFVDPGDDTQLPLGTVTVCGSVSPTFTIELEVVDD
jgi:hypothetical protein